jgi:hypothetical protein
MSKSNKESTAAEQERLERAAEEKFVEDTLIRGEAAEPDEEGNLPREATHEVVKREGKRPTLRRRLFKAF